MQSNIILISVLTVIILLIEGLFEIKKYLKDILLKNTEDENEKAKINSSFEDLKKINKVEVFILRILLVLNCIEVVARFILDRI